MSVFAVAGGIVSRPWLQFGPAVRSAVLPLPEAALRARWRGDVPCQSAGLPLFEAAMRATRRGGDVLAGCWCPARGVLRLSAVQVRGPHVRASRTRELWEDWTCERGGI